MFLVWFGMQNTKIIVVFQQHYNLNNILFRLCVGRGVGGEEAITEMSPLGCCYGNCQDPNNKCFLI